VATTSRMLPASRDVTPNPGCSLLDDPHDQDVPL
jgi:hypothetical protein